MAETEQEAVAAHRHSPVAGGVHRLGDGDGVTL